MLTAREIKRGSGLGVAVLALHVIGFGTLLLVVPRHFSLGHSGVYGVGVGLTAYTLGLRHAFDADHIAAIDNTTRKLMANGSRPLGVGLFFSLGHSTMVFALALLLPLGMHAIGPQVQDSSSTLHQLTGAVGTGISAACLYLIAAMNLAVLLGIVRIIHGMRSGRFDEAELKRQLDSRGLINRMLGPLARRVSRPWQMYPVGVLFGLGFDTASEVALLFLAAGAASGGLPINAILCPPVLLAAGMSLLDTIDGLFINLAYRWACFQPVRTVYYDLAVTGLSIAVAFIVGSVELVSIAADRLCLQRVVGRWISSVNPQRSRLH